MSEDSTQVSGYVSEATLFCSISMRRARILLCFLSPDCQRSDIVEEDDKSTSGSSEGITGKTSCADVPFILF